MPPQTKSGRMQQQNTQPQIGPPATRKPEQIPGFRKPLQQTAFGSRPSPVHHRRGMAQCCSMLALLPLPVPRPANPPRRLPVMRDFWQRWTNLALPPATRHPKASLPTPAPFGNPTISKPGQISGLLQPSPTDNHRALCRLDAPRVKATTCHLDVQTHLGPLPSSPANRPGARCPLRSSSGHGGSLPPRRPDTPRAAAIFTSRRFSGALPQPVHRRRATIRCRLCCHCCRFRQIRGPFPDKTHLSCHDKQAY